MTQIRYPHITGNTAEERLRQMEREMRRLVDDLNMALQALEQAVKPAQNLNQGRNSNGSQ